MAAIRWLAEQRRTGYIDDVLVIANHPMRLGIDSPHEMRNWRDAAPDIMIGMEGAPGAQGGGIPGWRGPDSQRGEYENAPSANSWPGYPTDAYVTYGGFDWVTATVGGLWDAMLSEGRLFTITTNSDVHRVVFDTWKNGDWPPGQNFDNTGRLPDPVNTTEPQPGGDFWPGQFSRTHVGVTKYGYRPVMAGLRAAGSGSTTASSWTGSTCASDAPTTPAAESPSAAGCGYAPATGSPCPSPSPRPPGPTRTTSCRSSPTSM